MSTQGDTDVPIDIAEHIATHRAIGYKAIIYKTIGQLFIFTSAEKQWGLSVI